MSAEQDEAWGWKQRLSAFGDLPTRAMQVGLRLVPWFLDPFLINCWTIGFMFVGVEQRRAVCGNLAVLFPGMSRIGRLLGAFRMFREFAYTYVDAVRCEEIGGEVDWAIEGLENFDDLAARREGCLVMTAHMGNYDLAAPLFSGKFGRTVHAVRAPERDPRMQKIRERELAAWQERHPGFRVHYNRPEGMLAVELAKILADGDVVAVQADRVVFEVSGAEVPVGNGWQWMLPRGPMMLAQATAAPCFPLFVLRDGWRRYRVKVGEVMELPKRKRGSDGGLQVWADLLLPVVREHWTQWFVFEAVFRRDEE